MSQRRRFKVRKDKLQVRPCQPCGEASPYHDWFEARGRANPLEHTVDVTRTFLPSAGDRDRHGTMLRQITAALPLMTERQRAVIIGLGQGQTYRQLAAALNCSRGTVENEVEAARQIILGMAVGQDEQSGI